MRKIARFTATAAASFVIYILLVMPLKSGELILGAAVALLSAAVLYKFLPFDRRIFNPVRIVKGILYGPYFLWKMIVANIEIALIVISPVLKIKPSIVKGRTLLQSNEGKLLLTSSITLTPGTLSIDLKDDQVYIHRVKTDKTSDTETQEEVIHPFEKFIKGVTE